MADLAAIQTEIMPRLERLLALAAGWAEILTLGSEPRQSSVAAAGQATPAVAGGAPAGMTLASVPGGPAVEPGARPGAMQGDAASRRTIPAEASSGRRPQGSVPAMISSAPHPVPDPVTAMPRANLRQVRQDPRQRRGVDAAGFADPPAGNRPSMTPHAPRPLLQAALPRFRLARGTRPEPPRPPAFSLAGAGVAPDGVGVAPAFTSPAPPAAAFGRAVEQGGPALPRLRAASPTRSAPLPLPPLAVPTLSGGLAAPMLSEEMLEDALADLLERAALEAGVAPP